MKEYKNLIKRSYSKNSTLKRLTDIKLLKSLGYPDRYLSHFYHYLNIFPVAYPFENINLKNKKILDIGCGSGFDAFCALNEGAKLVVGIDISFSVLISKHAINNFYKICADLDEGVPINQKIEFDLIIFNGSFNQIIKKFSVLKNLKTLLKKDGIIVICDLIWCGTTKEKEFYSNNFETWIVNIGGSLTEKDIWNILNKLNLEVLKYTILEEIYPLKRFKVIAKK